MTALPGASPHARERSPSTARRDVSLTRRSLLRVGAVGAGATFVGLRPWAAAPAAAAPRHLLRSSYEGRVGEAFRVGSANLQLLSVDDLSSAAVDKTLVGSENAFALVFAGPLGAPLAGATHAVRHPALGRFELFVSAVGRQQSERYEAVIDRSVRGPRSAHRRTAAAVRPAAPPRVRMVRRIALRRTSSGARADALLTATAGAERVFGRLGRRGKTIAVAAGDVRRQRAMMRFHGTRGLRSGTYTMTLVLVDSAGVASVRRRRVRLA